MKSGSLVEWIWWIKYTGVELVDYIKCDKSGWHEKHERKEKIYLKRLLLGKRVRALRKGIVVPLLVISGSFIDCELGFEKVCIKKMLPN